MPSLFRNTFYTSLSQGWQMLMAVALFMVASRRLGEIGFGRYTLATTIMYFILLFNDLGLNTLATREIARDKASGRSLMGHLLGLKLLLVPAGWVLLGLFLTSARYDSQTRTAVLIFAVSGLSGSFTQAGYAVFRAHERMEIESAVSIVEKTVATGLGCLALGLGFGLLPFSAAFALASLLALGLSMSLLRKHFVRPDVRFGVAEAKRLLRGAAPFGVSMLVTSVYGRVDVLMLSIMDGMDAVGQYGVAQRLLSYTSLVPTVFATAFFPRFSVLANRPDELSRVFTTGMKYLLVLAVPLVPAVILLSRKLILFFAGEAFLEAAGALVLVSVASGILFVNIFLASLYGATNHQKRILVIECAALVVNAGGNALLIPRFSYLGSALAMVVTEGLVILIALTWSLKHIARWNEFAFLPKVAVAASAMALCLHATMRMSLWAQTAAGAGLYFSILFAWEVLDVRQLKKNIADLKAVE